MNLDQALLWWIIAGALVVTELMTGSFYLLMLAIGAVAGAVAAHLGLGVTGVLLSAGLVGGGATLGWHLRRGARRDIGERLDTAAQSLDIGQTVMVEQWVAPGATSVSFRGSTWQARAEPGTPLQPGAHTIVAIEGNHLILRRS